jgi:hypothetical protein
MDWKNRIVGEGVQRADWFVANPRNWRIHPEAQQDALAGALDEIGWIQRVIVNKATGCVIDGHMRVALALSKGDETPVPYIEVDLTEDEEALALAIFDPISAMAGTDAEKLNDLIRRMDTQNAGIMDLLAELQTEHGFTHNVNFNAFASPKDNHDLEYRAVLEHLIPDEARRLQELFPTARIIQHANKAKNK